MYFMIGCELVLLRINFMINLCVKLLWLMVLLVLICLLCGIVRLMIRWFRLKILFNCFLGFEFSVYVVIIICLRNGVSEIIMVLWFFFCRLGGSEVR